MIVNPGIRRFLGSAIQRLFNSASFYAPLTHTLALERGTGSPTFTRASTATVTNNDGYLVTALAGEARFVGARRVRNLLPTNSDDLTTWTLAANTAITGGFVDPDGGATAYKIVTSTASINQGVNRGSLPVGGYTCCDSVWLKGAVGGEQVVFGDATSRTSATLTTSWQRFQGVKSKTSQFYVIYSNSLAQTWYVWHPQAEDVTGQSVQTAGEYVSVGVESAPYYHGSMQDGIKCFPTDLSGNPIPSTTMLGYQAEGARTNLCLQSNAFTTTWANTGTPSATQNVIGPDGGTTGWTLTDNDGAAFEAVRQIIAHTAANHTFSCFVKKTTGAQASYPLLYIDDAVSKGAVCTVDTTNGVATVWTAYTGLTIVTSSAACVSYNDDYWRVSLTYLSTAANWTVYLFPAGTTNATQSTGTIDANATGSAVFYGAQVELGSSASSYIATTTIAVTRNADVLTYSSAGNILGTVGSVSYTAIQPVVTGFAGTVVGDSASNRSLVYQSSGLLYYYDGTNNLAYSGGAVVSNNVSSNYSSNWSGVLTAAAKDGALMPNVRTFDGDFSFTAIGIGHANSTAQAFGNIKNVRFWQRALSSSELQAVTAS